MDNTAALKSLLPSDVEAILAAFPAIAAAIPGGAEFKAAVWAIEQHLEDTNPTEISLGPIHVHWRQFPIEARQGILTTLFGPRDANAPAITDAAAALLKLVP